MWNFPTGDEEWDRGGGEQTLENGILECVALKRENEKEEVWKDIKEVSTGVDDPGLLQVKSAAEGRRVGRKKS